MRERILYGLGAVAAALLVRNIWKLLTGLPDEAFQGAIFRIIFFHVPAAFTSFTCFLCALIAGIAYLKSKNLKWDSFGVSVTEVGLAFGAANLISGMIWARIIWGIWWTWDWRLTSMLICWLLYAGYLVLRRAIEEPTERARLSAVMSILSFSVVPFVFFSIKWFRTQHPQPVLFGDGKMDTGYRVMLYSNWIPLLMFAAILVAVRMMQERRQREIDALRRAAHAF
ncbi:MAG: cytochrome c biogenesis protein CcsA [Candidatus Solibacter usitatus]|nr:cytochrome c biogenesis protein CcsA [Candidatus Solibacter usitatus]